MPPASPRRSRRPSEAGASSLVIHNVVVSGHRTSVRLEPLMWEALQEIARDREMTLHELVTEINRERRTSSLTAGIRVYIVAYYRAAARNAERTTPTLPATFPQEMFTRDQGR